MYSLQLLNVISDPFHAQIASASVASSFTVSVGLFMAFLVLFCIMRQRHQTVFAPKEHITTGNTSKWWEFIMWMKPVWQADEIELVGTIGPDAVIFLRFIRMSRNIMVTLFLLSFISIIPVVYSGEVQQKGPLGIMRATPLYLGGTRSWAYVVMAYALDSVTFIFIWHSERCLQRLKIAYYRSPLYKSRVESRTIMITNIPKQFRSNAGILELLHLKQEQRQPIAGISQDSAALVELIKDHKRSVEALERLLMPPLTTVGKIVSTIYSLCQLSFTRGQNNILASELEDTIRLLVKEIHHYRVKTRFSKQLTYGFATYTTIRAAHRAAVMPRRAFGGSHYIRPSPLVHDIIWKNLGLDQRSRRQRLAWTGLTASILTMIYIIPNIFIATFLYNLSNLALVWPSFEQNLRRYKIGWSIVQGILGPLVQTIIYMALPPTFRRLLGASGHTTKSSREASVLTRLFSFFIFNKFLVFSIFTAFWSFVSAAASAKRNQESSHFDVYQHLFSDVVASLYYVTPFWLSWQLQQCALSALDLLQPMRLFSWYLHKRFLKPTPRKIIKLKKLQPFDYAEQYNLQLFSITIALSMGVIQPLILPAAAFSLVAGTWFKTYQLLRMYRTKHESHGSFWRILIDRLLFACVLSNAISLLVITSDQSASNKSAYMVRVCLIIPLPLIILTYRWLVYKHFNTIDLNQFDNTASSEKSDRTLEHPAFHEPLPIPFSPK